MVLFSLATFVLFHFALDQPRSTGDLAAGILWVTLLFAAVLGINRLFVAEREEGGFDGFLLAPVDRTALFVAKATVLFVFLARSRSSSVAGVHDPAARAIAVAAGCRSWSLCSLLADVGLAVVGTLVAALAVQTRARDLLVPLLALPLSIPLVIAGARATRATAGRRRRGGARGALAG